MNFREEWFLRLQDAEQKLGLSDGFKFLYTPWSTIESAQVAFLSLNPGVPPDEAELRVISDERGNSYEIERETTRSPITAQFLALAKLINLPPASILTGVAAPFRTNHWEDLSTIQSITALELGREFWSKPLLRSDLRLILAVSAEAAALAVDLTNATFELELPAYWGTMSLRRYRTPDGRAIIHLPHLSRFQLLSRPASRAAIAQILGYTNEALFEDPALRLERKTAPSDGVANEISSETRAAIAALPAAVAAFFHMLCDHPDYGCKALTMQMTVQFRGEKVGGLNRRISEWYVSKLFVGNHGGAKPLTQRGFKHIKKGNTHEYWAFSGSNSLEAFEQAMVEMTGVPLRSI